MGKRVDDSVLDAAFNLVKNNAALITLCSQEPTTRAEAVTTYKLAEVSITSTDFTGPSDNGSNGRKLTVNAHNAVTIAATGVATHVAIVSDSILFYVTTCTSKQVYSGDSINFPAWSAIIEDPV